jgi:hypothetical protein
MWRISIFLLSTVSLAAGIVLMFPKIDLENAPIDFFYFDHGNATEVTVVFKDEDHPNGFLDPLYDLYRLAKWGRIKDIETFYIYEDKVIFPDDYASVTSFYQTEDLHTHAEIPLDEFQRVDGKIVVYVNTWNHMFSNKPLPDLEYVPFIFKPKIGTRDDAEKIYSIYK